MKSYSTVVLLTAFFAGVQACFSTAARQYSSGSVQQFQAPAVQQPAPAFGVPARAAAAANAGPRQPIATHQSVLQYLLGQRISTTEFSAEGYNAEGGGPVNRGAALSCYMDGRPCCWANVPPPDDQLDWQIATGKPDSPYFQNVPAPEGSYLIAYARGAAPSDEAQFASCSIACAASPITIRAKHWQSENVLLQVCQRESFPNTVNFNPLLNCQEFPLVNGVGTTELVLPKASLIDIVFVASNFVGENGDMAILDDIEISYDADGPECQKEEDNLTEAAQRLTVETDTGAKTAVLGEKTHVTGVEKTVDNITGGKDGKKGAGVAAAMARASVGGQGKRAGGARGAGGAGGAGGARGAGGAAGGAGARGAAGAAALAARKSAIHEKLEFTTDVDENGHSLTDEETVIETNPRALGKQTVKVSESKDFSKEICQNTKCDFEDGSICNYKDAHQTQSIRGLTTKFQVVSGQFMNRVTGVKESIEGSFYAATFLFPREMAGLEVQNAPFTESSRLRFHYYEGTHGVQLKGCCDTLDSCPFSSDKFVTVNDRVWKTASFKCPKGTEKLIFVCENTRTNQGACAIDDIRMVEPKGKISQVQPLC